MCVCVRVCGRTAEHHTDDGCRSIYISVRAQQLTDCPVFRVLQVWKQKSDIHVPVVTNWQNIQ